MKNKQQKIDLLKRFETVLLSVKASRSDLYILRELLTDVESLEDRSSSRSPYSKPVPAERFKTRIRPASYKTRLKEIANIYKGLAKNQELSDTDLNVINLFEVKHPNIRSFIITNKEGLYDKVSQVGDKAWSAEELRLILLYHFDINTNPTTPKSELINMVKKNIYNFDYMDSMKNKYEGKI